MVGSNLALEPSQVFKLRYCVPVAYVPGGQPSRSDQGGPRDIRGQSRELCGGGRQADGVKDGVP